MTLEINTRFIAQRSLEQRYFEDVFGTGHLATAQARGSLNKRRPIGQNNLLLDTFLQIADLYLEIC